MKNISRNVLIIVGLLGLVSPAQAVITYTITSGASGNLTASGSIFDGMTNIGSWTSTLTATTISDAFNGSGTLAAVSTGVVTAGLATSNSAPQLGLFMWMAPYTGAPNLIGTPGVQTFSIAFSATVGTGYSVKSAFISGRVAPGPTNFGPAIVNGTSAKALNSLGAVIATLPNTNSLTFSGFSGNAVLTDTDDNLVQATGATIATGGILNWKQSARPDGAYLEANTNWFVTIPSASALTITYAADFGQGANGVWTSAYNEAVGFGFDIIPEPSSTMLIGAGVLGLLVRRRRSN